MDLKTLEAVNELVHRQKVEPDEIFIENDKSICLVWKNE